MENASKALLIAGAVLIALVIVSLGVVLFNRFSGPVKNNSSLSQQEIQAFNNKITPYTGRNISGSQVNALVQTAVSINYNALKDNNTSRYVTITGDASVVIEGEEVSSQRAKTGKFYTVTATANDSGLLTNIEVTENEN